MTSAPSSLADPQLAGRRTIVTGAGGGIGRATARLFAEAGARVALLDLDEERARETRRLALEAADQASAPPRGEGESRGGSSDRARNDEEPVFFLETDVSDPDAVENAVDEAADRMGGLDGLVNVVGVSGRKWGDGPVTECTEAAWDNLMAVNLKSTFLCCKFGLRHMEEGGGGSVVNISSVLGIVGGDEDFATHAYATTKGGVISLTRSIATYYAPERIRANAVCPGLIRTPMSERAQTDPTIQERLSELQPLTGDFGEPEDVAHAALYLVSERASFVTGTVFPVDGGWTAK